jgi:ResB-like family
MSRPATKLRSCLLVLGSVKMTLVLLIVGALVMSLGTVLESRLSTDFAQSVVYGHLWFDIFLLLIVLNLLAAVLNRLPLKRHQFSFVVVHASIILLMVGAWISRTFGFEGQLPVAEGQSSAELLLYDRELVLTSASGGQHAAGQALILRKFPVPDTVFLAGHRFQAEASGNPGIKVIEYISSGFQESGLQQGLPGSGAGIEFQVAGHGESLDGWLLSEHAEHRRNDLGPFVVEMLQFSGQEDFQHRLSEVAVNPSLTLKAVGSDQVHRFSLPQDIGKDVDLSDGVSARIVQYFEHARVTGDGLMDDPGAPWNPAAIVEVWRGDQQESHTIFGEFPDFAVHQIPEQGPLAESILLDAPNASGKPILTVLVGPDDQLFSQITDAQGRHQADPAGNGSHIDISETGFHFTLKRVLAHAVHATTQRAAEPGEEGGRALMKLQVSKAGQQEEFWLAASGSRQVPLLGSGAQLSLRRKTKPLPFRISVEDFQVEFYPGSRRASNYASKVQIAAIDGRADPLAATISMNRPLDYMGYRLFQSSYVLGQGGGPDTTVLTVSYDPGVTVVYLAFVLLIFGVAWFSLGDGRKKKSPRKVAKLDTDITLVLEPSKSAEGEYSVQKTEIPSSAKATAAAETPATTRQSRS